MANPVCWPGPEYQGSALGGEMGDATLPTQHRARGWILRITSWLMRVAGFVAAVVGFLRTRTSSAGTSLPGHQGPPWYINILIAVAIMAVGMILIAFSLRVGKLSRLHLTKTI